MPRICEPSSEPEMLRDEVAITLDVLDDLLGQSAPPELAIRLWDGTIWRPYRLGHGRALEEPTVTLVLQHPGALRAMLWPPGEMTIPTVYLAQDIDVEGSFECFIGMSEAVRCEGMSFADRLRIGHALRGLPKRNGPPVATYDALARIFATRWIDGRLLAACAGLVGTDAKGEPPPLASHAEHALAILRSTLNLHAGQRLLVIGDSWDSLLQDASDQSGILALGLPPIPAGDAQGPAHLRQHQQHRYRDDRRAEPNEIQPIAPPNASPDHAEPFHAVLSVDLFSRRGPAWRRAGFADAWRLLQPGGRCLVYALSGEADVLHQHIWPADAVGPLRQIAEAAKATGFTIERITSRRQPALRVLRDELARLEAAPNENRTDIDETAHRLWRLALGGSGHAFASRKLDIHELLLTKPGSGPHRVDWNTTGRGW